MKRVLFTLVCIMTSIFIWSQEFVVDGLTYQVKSEVDKTVDLVSARGAVGDVVVPTSVTTPNSEVISVQWETLSGPTWTETEKNGVTTYKSGVVNDNESTVIRCIFRTKGSIAFKCRNQGEVGCDYLTVGGVDASCSRNNYTNSLAGSYSWKTIIIAPGDEEEHFVEFCYSKDGSASNYPDCAEIYVCDYSGEEYSVVGISDNVFSNCPNVTRVEISSTFSGFLPYFYNCPKLQSIVLPQDVRDIPSRAFLNCKSLTGISIPEGVTSIGSNAFSLCSSLAEVNLPSTLETIGNAAFQGCSSLQSITIPENVKTIGAYIFMDCLELESVDMKSAGFECYKYESSDSYSNSITYYYLNELGSINSRSRGSMYSVVADRKYIHYYSSFYNCPKLSKITISEGITAIPECFCYNLSALTECDIPSTVTKIGGYAFYGCSSLMNVTIPEGTETIGEYAFNGCRRIREFIVPSTVKGFIPNFNGCINLTRVLLPTDLTEVPDRAFYGCVQLQELDIPESVESIGEMAFGFCRSLKSITIPQNVKSIGIAPFLYCTNLETVNINAPNIEWKHYVTTSSSSYYTYYTYYNEDGTVNNNSSSYLYSDYSEKIDDNYHHYFSSFKDCSKLSFITLPENIKDIPSAFCSSSNTDIRMLSATPGVIGKNAISDIAVIYVPANSVEAYRSAWTDYQFQIVSDGKNNYDVTTEARDNSSDVMDMVNNAADSFDALLDVLKLKVKGTINSYDIMVMRNKMLNLRELDLSEADIVANSYEYYTGYHSTDSILGSYSFYNLKRLRKVALPNSVKSVGYNALSNCHNLKEVTIGENTKSIDSYVFGSCSNLKDVHFNKNLNTIGSSAFQSCSNLTSLELPDSLTSIGYQAFYDCYNLKEVTFPPHLTSIGDYAFRSCYNLESVMLPTTLKTIGYRAFEECSNLKEVRIPESITSIGNYAFNTSSITDIYTWTIEPTNINQDTFNSSLYTKATLHVPETAQKLYWWDTQWSQFQTIRNFNAPYTYFYLAHKDLIIDKETPRLEGEGDNEPNADLLPGSGLIVEGDESQDLGDVNLEVDGSGDAASIVGDNSSTETSGANVNINNLNIKIQINAGRWYFFAFPFDIEYANIHFNGQFVWRYYDGEFRAEHGSGAWKNHTGKIEKGKGYIFQASKSGTLTMTIPNASIGGDDKMIALESHASENVQDASWNLVGNPFTSYYDLSSLGYNAPITVWNGSTYEAYNPQDDDLTIYPFQAFFVQKPKGTENVEFAAAARETKNQSLDENHKAAAKARRMAKAKSNVVRELVNIEVSDGENTDKTRVVFNETSSMEYEMECDAAKFFTASVPQIYTLDANNAQYAINERPTGNGTVKMGFTASHDGEYTISATRMDCPMMLRDLELNITHSLSEGAYTFQAKSGEYANRFELVRGNDATGITNAKVETAETEEYFNVNGVKSNKDAKGVVIVKGKKSAKKMMKL